MNGMPNTVNRVFGSISANFSRSASPVDRISEGVYSQQGLYISYTPRYILHALHCLGRHCRICPTKKYLIQAMLPKISLTAFSVFDMLM